jgi:CheY-like chemotaxis protein
VGAGTTFRLLLPLVATEHAATPPEAAKPDGRGSETVLVVEDEDAVRTVVRISLERHGYKVLEANCGADAVRQAETHPGAIHLLVSDVVMPAMGGRQLLEAVRRHRPGLRVLFMSGYTDDAVLLHGVVDATDAFIQKPFTPLGLAEKVRQVIDNSAR